MIETAVHLCVLGQRQPCDYLSENLAHNISLAEFARIRVLFHVLFNQFQVIHNTVIPSQTRLVDNRG